jgi:glycine hydroxymethyltransferase
VLEKQSFAWTGIENTGAPVKTFLVGAFQTTGKEGTTMSISAHPQTLLTRYLTTLNGAAPNSAAAAVYASLDQVRTVAPSVAAAIINEVDAVEEEAATLARNLFGADHAYVQPHSGADANLVAFLTILSATVQRPLLTELGQEDPSKVSGEEWAKIRAAVHNQRLLSLNY